MALLDNLIKDLTLLIEKNPGGKNGIPYYAKNFAKLLTNVKFHWFLLTKKDYYDWFLLEISTKSI